MSEAPASLRLLVCGSETWTDPAPIRALLEVVRPDDLLHITVGPGWIAGALAAELGLACEAFPLDPADQRDAEHRRNGRILAARPTHAAAFVVGRSGEHSGHLAGGLVPHLRAHRLGRGRDVVGLPVIVHREDGVEGPPIKAKSPKSSDIAFARDELRRLWWATPSARASITLAGAAVAAATKESGAGPGFARDFEAKIAAASGAVQTLSDAEPRIAPWLAIATTLLRKWTRR